MASKVQTLLTQFLEYLEIEKNRSQLTVRNYDFYLQRFFEFAKIQNPGQLDLEKVRQFRLYLNRLNVNGKTLKKSTQNYHIIALRSFLKFLAKRDIKTLAAEKLELAKIGERSVDFLEGSDLERILEAPLKSKSPEVIRLRDRAILELLFSTGLRVSELVNLKEDSINLKKDEFTVRGKGDKPRVVFISNQARHAIKNYLEKRKDTRDKGQGTKEAKPLSARSVQRMVENMPRQPALPNMLHHIPCAIPMLLIY